MIGPRLEQRLAITRKFFGRLIERGRGDGAGIVLYLGSKSNKTKGKRDREPPSIVLAKAEKFERKRRRTAKNLRKEMIGKGFKALESSRGKGKSKAVVAKGAARLGNGRPKTRPALVRVGRRRRTLGRPLRKITERSRNLGKLQIQKNP